MKTFRYSGDDEIEIPSARVIVKPGDTFEVEDDDIAAGLAGQGQFEDVAEAEKPAPKAKSKAAPVAEKEEN